MSVPSARTGRDGPARATTLELFFDLVFVFTATQLTEVLVEDTSFGGAAWAVVVFGLIWWMFNAYVWLTNELPPRTDRRRLLLFTSMVGFLVMALAIPRAFEEGAEAKVFAAGYALVVIVHAGLFSRTSSAAASRAILRLAPFNLTSAALVLLGAFLGGTAQFLLWTAALLIEALAPRLHGRLAGFTIRPEHFVERHGLIMIIAFGESLIAIALGATGLPFDFSLVATAVLTLIVAACLWWVYFRPDVERAERALARQCDTARAVAAVNAYNYAHIPLLLGVVVFAAGVKKVPGHAMEPATTAGALYVGAGLALFLCGHAWFRRILHLGGPWLRITTAAAVLATVPVGLFTAALTQLAAVAVVLCTALALGNRVQRRQARAEASGRLVR
ncbi:Low temperature requirement protein LtrA [Streptomyces wuyuanensis]|uniref:Low temperature requirement protein LtrA n=1 Tax=Streptomyces wuyuanensis TaxID=1196353 RepID=A0A1G9TQ72_9ACTN|nr:Low temperature requirement protein LtrA [Streptomyces wuyuanensis]